MKSSASRGGGLTSESICPKCRGSCQKTPQTLETGADEPPIHYLPLEFCDYSSGFTSWMSILTFGNDGKIPTSQSHEHAVWPHSSTWVLSPCPPDSATDLWPEGKVCSRWGDLVWAQHHGPATYEPEAKGKPSNIYLAFFKVWYFVHYGFSGINFDFFKYCV